ncbi:unnamed protein product [Clonostachys rhizophaga]|uniref:Uncharacterized protein n=1 Tax=Clonostachys rhizophaga TaxID=160324 RepID=A0A9N9VNJ5_9HYPO|nr:unnamed protein product [Clonostachys rhizophaga]
MVVSRDLSFLEANRAAPSLKEKPDGMELGCESMRVIPELFVGIDSRDSRQAGVEKPGETDDPDGRTFRLHFVRFVRTTVSADDQHQIRKILSSHNLFGKCAL